MVLCRWLAELLEMKMPMIVNACVAPEGRGICSSSLAPQRLAPQSTLMHSMTMQA